MSQGKPLVPDGLKDSENGHDRSVRPGMHGRGGGSEGHEALDSRGPARSCGRTRDRARVPFAALVLSFMIAAAWASGTASDVTPQPLYVAHPTILIDGDGDFTPANGVVGGLGTQADPFLISGWEIDASSANGIEVRNTTGHFSIADTRIHSGSPNFSAVVLWNAPNARIDNCTLEGGLHGIWGNVTENITVSGNRISGSGNEGIELVEAHNASIEGNDVTDSGVLNTLPATYFWSGIVVKFSNNVAVVGNSLAYNDHFGMDLYLVVRPVVTDNEFRGNWGGALIDDAIDALFSRNVVYDHAGYGFCATNTSRTNVTENSFTDNLFGILFAGALGDPLLENSNVTVARNAGSGNHMTVVLSGIADARIAENDLLATIHTGILVEMALRVDLVSNRMTGGDFGISYYESNESLIEGNNVSSCVTGVMSTASRNVTMFNNSLSSCSVGTSLETSAGWRIFHNIFEGNALQASDDAGAANTWDDGYPSGGNWWSDYGGVDDCSGPLQNNCPDPDGIGDTAHVLDFNSRDRYPLWVPSEMEPRAFFNVSPATGNVSTAFLFDANASWDPNEPPANLEVRWDWENDGTYDTSWTPVKTAVHSYGSVGMRQAGMMVRDSTGRTNETQRWVNVLNTPPSASFSVAPPIGGLSTSFLFDASSSSDLEDASTALEVRWDWEGDGGWDTPWTTQKTASHLFSNPGIHSVALEVKDTNGFSDTAYGSAEVRPGPVTAITVGNPNHTAASTYVNQSTQFSFSVLDQSGTGIDRTMYRDNGGPWQNYSLTGPFALSTEGLHVLEWYSGDNVGNVEPVQIASYLVDVSPPSSSLTVGTPSHSSSGTYITSSTALTMQAAETGSVQVGISRVEYRIDGVSWTQYSGPFTLASEGAHTVEYNSTDLLGNLEATQVMTLVVDDTPPDTSLALGDPKSISGANYVTSSTALSLQASDGPSNPAGLNATEYRVDGLGWNVYSTGFVVQGEGPHTIDYRSTDLLGNVEPFKTLSVIVDDAPPFTVINPSASNGTTDSRYALSATDNGSGVLVTEYGVDDGAWMLYAGPFNLTAGQHIVRFRSSDRLANLEPERSLTVRISAPIPEPEEPPVEQSAQQNLKPVIAAAFSALLALAGVYTARMRNPGGPWKRLWLTNAFPFVALEAATGVLSVVTGVLAIPPLFGPGTAVDLGVLVLGMLFILLNGRKGPGGGGP